MSIWRVDSHSCVFRQVIYFPSRPGYTDPHVKRRVLDYLLFMNSKVIASDSELTSLWPRSSACYGTAGRSRCRVLPAVLSMYIKSTSRASIPFMEMAMPTQCAVALNRI